MFWDKKERKQLSDATIRTALGSPDWLSGVRIGENGQVTLIIETQADDLEAAEAIRIEAEARDRKSTRLNSSHVKRSRMPSSA